MGRYSFDGVGLLYITEQRDTVTWHNDGDGTLTLIVENDGPVVDFVTTDDQMRISKIVRYDCGNAIDP